MTIKPLLLLISILPVLLFALDDSDRDLVNNRNRLSEIKNEIKSLNSRLTKSQKEALSVGDQIKLLDEEMGLISQAKGFILREQRILERRSTNNRTNLSDTKIRLEKHKKLYSDRLVYMYKFGKAKNLALLLTSASFNQALIRYKYLKLIAEYDEKTIKSIQEDKVKIEKLQRQLSEDLSAKDKSIREKQKEEENFKNRLNIKSGLLASIKQNQSYFRNQITEKKKEQEKLLSIIAVLERARKQQETSPSTTNEEYVTIDFENFKKGKGKLPWPVKGKIATKFGKQYDPVSKTSINNSGVEINSKVGTPVKCVFTGVVRMITYLGGYGNTVIVDHGNGYYTVYSYLGEIYVRKNDIVETSQIIAQVGDSGSLAGSKLHFEIYGGNQPFNPQYWLRK